MKPVPSLGLWCEAKAFCQELSPAGLCVHDHSSSSHFKSPKPFSLILPPSHHVLPSDLQEALSTVVAKATAIGSTLTTFLLF